MSRLSALRLTLAFAATVLFNATVSAIPQTYVARDGNNLNACTETAPCATFAAAITKTDAKGEIIVLDSGEYGPVTITKSVRITAVGVYAGITVTSVNAVTVNAAANDVVALRGLTINGKGAIRGVSSESVGTLHVEGCTINGLGTGIYHEGTGSLFVNDTIVRNNGTGIAVRSNGDYVSTALIDHCKLEKNSYGLSVKTTVDGGSVKVTVRDSVAAGNQVGYYADGGGVQLNVFDSAAVNNSGVGFYTLIGAKINAQHCVSSNNSIGFIAAGGSVLNAKDCTAANNTMHGMQSIHATSKLTAEGCQITNNLGDGLSVSNGGMALISDTLVTGHNVGLRNNSANPGTLKTFGNNRVDGNTTNKLGTIIAVAQM